MSVECVAADNKLVNRELILLELAASWGIRWMLEQPVPNLMIQHPMSAWKLKRLGEGCLVAGKELWGTRPRWYLCLWQRRILRGPKLLDLSLKFRRRAIATSSGGQRHQMAGLFVTGGPDLKQTKSYPAILGVQLALARNTWLDAGMHFAKKARALHPIARLATQSYSCIADLVGETAVSGTADIPLRKQENAAWQNNHMCTICVCAHV